MKKLHGFYLGVIIGVLPLPHPPKVEQMALL
jgi:hypothetical protein